MAWRVIYFISSSGKNPPEVSRVYHLRGGMVRGGMVILKREKLSI